MPRRLALAALALCALPSSALANPSLSVSTTAAGVPGNLPSQVTHRLTLTAEAFPETVTISTLGRFTIGGNPRVDEQTAVGPGLARCAGRWERLHQPLGARSRFSARLTIAPFTTAFVETKTAFEDPPWASDSLDATWDITPAQGSPFQVLSSAPDYEGGMGVELGFAMTRVAARTYAVAGTALSGVNSGRVEVWGYAPGRTRATRLATARVRGDEWSISRLQLPRTGRWEFYARYRSTTSRFADDASVCGTVVRVR